MSKKSAWLDANIILRFLLKDHPKYFEAAFHLFSEAEKGKIILYLHPLILAEVVLTLQGYYGYSKSEIAGILGSMIESEGLFLEDIEVARKAFKEYAKNNVDYIDAYLAACAVLKGPEVIYTMDKKHFSRLEGDIRVV